MWSSVFVALIYFDIELYLNMVAYLTMYSEYSLSYSGAISKTFYIHWTLFLYCDVWGFDRQIELWLGFDKL